MHRPFQLTALLAALAAAGCSDRRRPDSELDGLVHVEREEAEAIDVDDAAREVSELVRALATPHHQIASELGPHTVTASSSVEASTGAEVVLSLADKTRLAVDAKGQFTATADNDQDYGRHAIYAGGSLYLRPRYGKYHRRPPNEPGEPAAILDEMYSTTSAYFDLLWTGAELSDRGATSFGDRPARKIEISLAPSHPDRPAESVTQKKWRETIDVDEVSGEVILDNETGTPLSAEITGSIKYVRDGASYRMKLEARHRVEPGEVATITAPAAEQTVSAPAASGEVAERRKLLEGLSSSTGGD
jgi:hypothetical protein